jgi:hypothetical protein
MGAERVNPNPSPQIGDYNQDQMKQMLQQLSMMLQQNNSKNSDFVANISSKCLHKWKLDSGATYHVIGNKILIKDCTNWEITQFLTIANERK